jgi:hypothetical protein
MKIVPFSHLINDSLIMGYGENRNEKDEKGKRGKRNEKGEKGKSRKRNEKWKELSKKVTQWNKKEEKE